MREIIFRGKRISDGEWVEGNLIRVNSYNYEQNSRCYIYIPLDMVTHMMARDIVRLFSVEVDPKTVCQYTGLKDKNGNMIFHGDKLDIDTYPFTSDGFKNYYGIVQWDEKDCLFYIMCYKYDDSKVTGISEGSDYYFSDFTSEQLEVIGNIHDSKDIEKCEN